MKPLVYLSLFPLLAFPLVGDIDFNSKVRPILSDKCFACHGFDEHDRKAGLRLDTFEGATSRRKVSPPAIVPGKPMESLFVERILDTGDPMPPLDSHKKLSKEETRILIGWVEAGAQYAKPWAYEPPRDVPVPLVKDRQWPINPLDKYLLARMEAEGVQPVRDADPVTLVRRLYFDLIGLPPTWEQAQAFATGKVKFDEVVDQLLGSPQFGERMAMYWLDLVRYADTVGYHGDQDHNISPYRDYVIRAFNQNLPFDQFTREQLAGDLIPNAGKWQKVASGYNRLLQTSHEGGVQKKEYDAIYAADRVRNVSVVWMAATMGCSQCHDHKFDPFTAKDHYSLAAFFADIPDTGFSGNSLPTKRPPEINFLTDEVEEEIRTLEGQEGAEAKKQLVSLKTQSRKTMVTQSTSPRTMRVLPRGNWLDDSGELVLPAIPAYYGELAYPGDGRATRLELANWFMDTEQGIGKLTARVFANRFWYLFFGRGISPSLEDFGGQGQPPSHPALLDHLAIHFYENQWDVKGLIRYIVTSRAYRMASTPNSSDPENRFFSQQGRFRLPAETLRDNALQLSGLLEKADVGGGSIKPYQPPGYYRHLNFPTRRYAHTQGQGQYRRGVYMHWQRMFLHPMLKAMDAPSREECTAQRPRSNTPNSALVLLNDPTFVEAALSFARRIMEKGPADREGRLAFAVRTALSRNPRERELPLLTSLYEEAHAYFSGNPGAGKQFLASAGRAIPPGDLPENELCAWATVARAILNLSETNTRN